MGNMLVYYGITIAALVITLAAQVFVSSAYSRYSKVMTSRGLTGAEAARLMLDRSGLSDVSVGAVAGNLTDHYDPRTKTVNLSQGIYSGRSVASVAVACHECGHAVQDSKGYALMRLRSALVPVTNLASRAGYIAILIGVLLSSYTIIKIGILAEAVILLFQLVTLPVEINASRRALAGIKEWGFLDEEERPKGRKMLTAAALTYVAGVLSALLQVLRLVLMFRRRDN